MLQLILSGVLITSHMTLAGHGAHEAPHFHINDFDHDHFHSESQHSDHAGEIPVHLNFIAQTSQLPNYILPTQMKVEQQVITVSKVSSKPLLPPPNSL